MGALDRIARGAYDHRSGSLMAGEPQESRLGLSAPIVEWTQYRADLEVNRRAATRAWLNKPRRRRMYQWYAIMLNYLRKKPRRALVPLDVAIHCPRLRPRRQILQDCMMALANRFLHLETTPKAEDVEMLHQFICDYARISATYTHNWPFQQRMVFLVMEQCDEAQLRSLFRSLLTYNTPMSSDTLLQFAEKFLNHGEALIGFEIIRSAINVGANPLSCPLQSACTKLLRIRPEQGDWYKFQSTVISELFAMGVQPSGVLWTCIIQNAVEAGQFNEAWHWYETGLNDGLKPNRITLFVLNKIAKLGNDESVCQKVIEEATRWNVLPHDMDLVFDILHTLYLLGTSRIERTQTPQFTRVFESMLEFYCQFCTMEPLLELGMEISSAFLRSEGSHQLSRPKPSIVSLMLMAYIKQFVGLQALRSIYDRYRSLVVSKHPVIAPIANTDHMANAFVMGFGYRRLTLHHCTDVVRHMLETTRVGFTPSERFRSTTPDQIGHPTLQTWNILMGAYAKQGNIEAAEKVLSMLRNRGFTPTTTTWNQLIRGFVDQQNVDKVIEATKSMKKGNLEYDDNTIAYLQRLVDKPRFFKALNDMDVPSANVDNIEEIEQVFYNDEEMGQREGRDPHESTQ